MKKSPFTLIEVIVAMLILVVIGSLIGTASAIFYRAYARSTEHTERMKEYVAIDQVMDQCVRNAIPFQWEDEDQKKTRYVFQGETDSVIFSTLRRSYANDKGALLFVRLRLIDDELVAEYSSYPLLPWELEENDDPERYTREVLTKNVQAISFLYAERDSEGEIEFLDEWIEDDHNGIPLAIQIEIEWKNGQKERWLRRTAGSAANATYGNRQNQNTLEQSSGRRGVR
ncbi:MAG: hypothetical protein E7040_04830 [Lentisphaerae bacterium]|nr:hypothetical protein [Lentisphaerota bacterium]